MEKCQCTQCGSTDFNKEGKEFIRCSHCHSLFRLIEAPTNAGLIINKGANVVFGKGGNVVVSGGMEIKDGANVTFLGRIEIVKKSTPEEIARAKQHLKKVDE